MPTLTSFPMVGGTGRLMSGRVKVTPTESFDYAGKHYTKAPQSGIIRDGQFYDATGAAPLTIPATPLGVGLQIDLYLMEQDGARGTTRVSKLVTVPDITEVFWSYLEDFMPAAPPDPTDPAEPGQGFGLTPFGLGPFGL